MTLDSIADIENHLYYLSKSALRHLAQYVGVSRYYAMNMEQLREAILAIAKGEVAPLPINKRHMCNVFSQHNQAIIDAVLELNQANTQK